jgi:hypothetical protein
MPLDFMAVRIARALSILPPATQPTSPPGLRVGAQRYVRRW